MRENGVGIINKRYFYFDILIFTVEDAAERATEEASEAAFNTISTA